MVSSIYESIEKPHPTGFVRYVTIKNNRKYLFTYIYLQKVQAYLHTVKGVKLKADDREVIAEFDGYKNSTYP